MAESSPASSTIPDEFYVGYLNPVPRGYARHIRVAVLVLAAVIACSAAVVGAFQSSAGDAVWETEPVVLTGLFIASPYPALLVEGDGEGAPPRTVMLVGAGKCGAFEPSGYCGLLGGSGGPAEREQARAAAMRLYNGKLVQVRGTRLRRDGRTMIELEENDRAVVAGPDDPERVARLNPGAARSVEAKLVGRVVDAKCYLGAMKPGDGKAHRACAIRCISGGIPPMLVAGNPSHPEYYLLASDSGPMSDAILPFVGDLIEVTGSVERQSSDIPILRADVASIRRR